MYVYMCMCIYICICISIDCMKLSTKLTRLQFLFVQDLMQSSGNIDDNIRECMARQA